MITFCCCKKDKDTITLHTISGEVFNLATDSALAGVKVYLHTNRNGDIIESLESISDANGNFIFTNVELHSSSAFAHKISIPSKSGIGGSEVGFNGTTIDVEKSNVSQNFKLNVVPKFLDVYVTISNPTGQASDSLTVLFQQNIFHKNVPSFPYVFGGGSYGNGTNNAFSFGNYPMGLYEITIDKWKGGVYTQTKDSLYLGWGDTKTYTINW